MERINVVIAMGDRIAMQSGVMLFSLMKNCSTPNLVDVHVITGVKELSDENKKKLALCVEPFGGRISFTELNLDKYMQHVDMTGYYTNFGIWFKFFAPRLFPKLKKFLYLDCDMLVLGDINEIYHVPLGKKVIAAVEDQGSKIKPKFAAHYKRVVGDNKYFNVGLLIVDCVKYRKMNADKKAIEYLTKAKPSLLEQDSFNHIFLGKVYWLDGKWNFFFKNLIFNVWHFFDDPKGIGIIHFQSPYKPFSSPRITRYEYAYMKYMSHTPWKNLICKRLLLKLLHPFFCIKLAFLVLYWKIKAKLKKK